MFPSPGPPGPGLIKQAYSAVGMNQIPGPSAEVVTGLDWYVRVPGHLLKPGVVTSGLIERDVLYILHPAMWHISADEAPKVTV